MFEEEVDEDIVEPQEQVNADVISAEEPQQESAEEQPTQQKMVPLSALQKERQKRREYELKLQWEQERNAQKPVQQEEEEDDSRYESATKADLMNSQEEALRAFEERLWIRQNPEKFEEINENLKDFLKLKPNLAVAIYQAPNRYQEAYDLMQALTPKQKQTMKLGTQQPKREAPNAPGSVPKSSGLAEAVDVMSMTDTEYAAWRASKRKRR